MQASVVRTIQRRAACLTGRPVRLILIGIALLGLLDPAAATPAARAEDNPAINCRHGLVFISSVQGYPIEGLSASGYLDEKPDTWPILPPAVEYIPVIRLRDLPETLDPVPTWVADHPGATWLIGDQPDNPANDALTPEEYAARYYRLAALIRRLDPTARLSFGSIAQPSPIRLRYLARAWDRLIALAGSRPAASALVDLWNIRAFYLDELPGPNGSSGAGIPPGFEGDARDAYGQVSLNETFNVSIFQTRLISFRGWMADQGEHQKPLWITAYGVWPASDQILDLYSSQFIKTATTYLENATDPTLGLTIDGNHLIQKWFWYSLNGPVSAHGGSLFDPDQPTSSPTPIGNYYFDYIRSIQTRNDVLMADLKSTPLAFHGPQLLADVQVTLSFANAGNDASGLPVTVTLWDGDPKAHGELIGTAQVNRPLPGCGTLNTANILWNNAIPFKTHSLFAQVDLADPPVEVNLDNNLASFEVVVRPPQIFLPLIASK
jgi:hypothetical protein